MIQFSWQYAVTNLIALAVEGAIAFRCRRFDERQLGPDSLPWIYHAGVWADILVLTPILGLIGPFVPFWGQKTIFICGVIGFLASWLMHRNWTNHCPIPDWINQPGEFSFSKGKITWPGKYHLLYAGVVISYLLGFFLLTPKDTPGYYQTVSVVMGLLGLFFPIAVMLPSGQYRESIERRFIIQADAIAQCLGFMALIVIATIIRLVL
ncbi:MAG: hypothetical protein A3A24_01240 [Candidatus Buchananbacteria bacterium RIFCSPLOWO2_01_FULL_46_12]|uniref:Uncharacterized protein n=1 Tax=Candidatus Buchananbacteria bacterium RIFCSPLOWO2_01_FULL_46_12 TaxID=1797546 RepID=A0A1G1YRA1_9BACT|nr:MAG: hypothetical protein A3A24_01240 [Candidatus Buchananbacteria bacterium RIFCSPLOWO2_01_FULL_46_12]